MEQLPLGGQDKQKVNPNVFLVGSTWQRLLIGAEDLGLFKEFQDGTMRGFTNASRESFKDFQGRFICLAVLIDLNYGSQLYKKL